MYRKKLMYYIATNIYHVPFYVRTQASLIRVVADRWVHENNNLTKYQEDSFHYSMKWKLVTFNNSNSNTFELAAPHIKNTQGDLQMNIHNVPEIEIQLHKVFSKSACQYTPSIV